MRSGMFVTVLAHSIYIPSLGRDVESPFTGETGRVFFLDDPWFGPEGPNYMRWCYIVFGPTAAKTECWIHVKHVRPATETEQKTLRDSTMIFTMSEIRQV